MPHDVMTDTGSYIKYIIVHNNEIGEYNSNNTELLDKEKLIEILLNLPEVQSEIN